MSDTVSFRDRSSKAHLYQDPTDLLLLDDGDPPGYRTRSNDLPESKEPT
jgi:hypothetical protein